MPVQGKRTDLAECFHRYRDEGLSVELVDRYPSQTVMYYAKMKQIKRELVRR